MAAFPNPATGQAWTGIRKMFREAKAMATLPDLWFHDATASSPAHESSGCGRVASLPRATWRRNQ